MAALDENGGITTDDPKLDEYARALDRLRRNCKERRRLSGDMSQTAHEALDGTGVGLNSAENAMRAVLLLAAAARVAEPLLSPR